MAVDNFFTKNRVKETKGDLREASNFFQRQIKKLKNAGKNVLVKGATWKKESAVEIGNMYFYGYDPKYKKTLPYYDRLPLVIPIEYYDNGFLGINLHYLSPGVRYKFLQQLIKIGGNPKLSDEAKLQLSYRMLKGVANSKYFKPTIHRYLYTHVKTQFNLIHPNTWKSVVYLPTAKWAKGKPY